jgi:hypothetical protein
MFRGVQVQWRPAAGERNLRNNILFRGDKDFRISGRTPDVLIAHQRPESTPGIGMSHRAPFAQLRILGMSAVKAFRLKRVKILRYAFPCHKSCLPSVQVTWLKRYVTLNRLWSQLFTLLTIGDYNQANQK